MNIRARKVTQALPATTSGASSLGVLRVIPTDTPMQSGVPGSPDHSTLLGGAWVHPLVDAVTTLGRGLHNTVVLADPAISRDHALLRHSATGWWVENASQQNGLFVDAHEIAPGTGAPLTPGATLRLGNTTLQLLTPADDAPTAESSVTPLDLSGTHLFNPGITLQFALGGQRGPRTWWIVGVVSIAVFLVGAALTLGAITLVGQNALATGGLTHILAALAIPLIPALGVSLLVAIFDRYEREPWFLLLAAFLWGAVVAIPPVLLVEHAVTTTLLTSVGGSGGFTHAALQALSAGVTEELFKGAGLALLVLALRDEFDNVTDGLLYGLLIGAGFAMVENYVYFALSPRGDLPSLIAGRVVLGWLSHSTFTALLGAGLGYARETRNHRTRWLAPLLGLLAAIALHSLFDFVVFGAGALSETSVAMQSPPIFSVATLLAAYLPLFMTEAVLLRLLLASLRREAATVRDYLAAEVVSGTVTPDEYLILQNAALRGLAERGIFFGYGLRAYLTARALHQTATGLAFRKWHVALGDPAKRGEKQPEDAYRLRIAKLRRSLVRQLTVAEAQR